MPSSQLRHEIDQEKADERSKKSCSSRNPKFYDKLRAICSYLEQLLFLEEMSKDRRDVFRRCARLKDGTRAVVIVPFDRRNRASVFEALDCNVFVYFSRKKIHNYFIEFFCSLLKTESTSKFKSCLKQRKNPHSQRT